MITQDDKAQSSAAPLLAKACKMGGHDWQEICAKIDAQHCQLWMAGDHAALVTQATVDNVLECLLAGGTGAKLWAHEAERVLSDFASENGIKRLRLWGRKGWMRIFPHWEYMGMEDGLVILERANEK